MLALHSPVSESGRHQPAVLALFTLGSTCYATEGGGVESRMTLKSDNFRVLTPATRSEELRWLARAAIPTHWVTTTPQYLVADEKTLPLREPPLQATRSMPPSYAKAAMRCNLAVNGDMLATFVRMSSNKDSSPP